MTVTNGLDESITMPDQQAFCSIVRLERQTEAGWSELRNCFTGAPPRFVTLAPHTERVVSLPGLPAGTWRASVSYTRGEVFRPGAAITATSPVFAVR